MKSPLKKNQGKFLAGLCLYALVVVLSGLFALKDYRYGLFGLLLLSAVTFAMVLWLFVKPKGLIALALCGAIVAAPVESRADDPPDKDAVAIACGVIVVGGIIVWGIWKICQLLPPPNPPPTNPPPPKVGGTNTNHTAHISSVMPALVMPDTSVYAQPGWQVAAIGFQNSTDGVNWTEQFAVTNWVCSDVLISVCYSNQEPLMTNVLTMTWSNSPVVSDFSSVLPSRMDGDTRLWRAVRK